MLHKTKGIVFHTLKYSETSVITKIYTEAFGLQSYIINGVRGTGRKFRASAFQPFNLLDLVIYKRGDKNLQRVKEFKLSYIFSSIPFDIVKGSIALFLIEMLNKAIKEEEQNEPLFDFIEQSIISLDKDQKLNSNFHLKFLLDLTYHLGIQPSGEFHSEYSIFDLQEGYYLKAAPEHQYFISPGLSKIFSDLSTGKPCQISLTQRNELLNHILTYFQLHITGFTSVKSHKILHEVLEN